jgi:hypothetical protein
MPKSKRKGSTKLSWRENYPELIFLIKVTIGLLVLVIIAMIVFSP